MHILAKAGIALAALAGAAVVVHHHAFAETPIVAQNAAVQNAVVVPKALEAQIRAMVRAHAPAGQADAAEAHAMAMIQAHLTQVAKDPAMSAEANQVMAAAAAGDQDALEHVHLMLMSIVGAEGHH